jgi:hypothetical protein
MLEVIFSKPHWMSDTPTPSDNPPIVLKQVKAAVVRGSTLRLQFPDVVTAQRAEEFLGLPYGAREEDVVVVESSFQRWFVQFQFFDLFEVLYDHPS